MRFTDVKTNRILFYCYIMRPLTNYYLACMAKSQCFYGQNKRPDMKTLISADDILIWGNEYDEENKI
jgi:hypothetical protein